MKKTKKNYFLISFIAIVLSIIAYQVYFHAYYLKYYFDGRAVITMDIVTEDYQDFEKLVDFIKEYADDNNLTYKDTDSTLSKIIILKSKYYMLILSQSSFKTDVHKVSFHNTKRKNIPNRIITKNKSDEFVSALEKEGFEVKDYKSLEYDIKL